MVCVRRTNETTQVYNVTLEAKRNTEGLIADCKICYENLHHALIFINGDEHNPFIVNFRSR